MLFNFFPLSFYWADAALSHLSQAWKEGMLVQSRFTRESVNEKARGIKATCNYLKLGRVSLCEFFFPSVVPAKRRVWFRKQAKCSRRVTLTSNLDFKGSVKRCWELMLKICWGRERKRGRQHMCWQRYNLKLDEKVMCLHVQCFCCLHQTMRLNAQLPLI